MSYKTTCQKCNNQVDAEKPDDRMICGSCVTLYGEYRETRVSEKLGRPSNGCEELDTVAEELEIPSIMDTSNEAMEEEEIANGGIC